MIVAIVLVGIAALTFLLGTALRSQSEALRVPVRDTARASIVYPAHGEIQFTLTPNIDGLPILRPRLTATNGAPVSFRVSPELEVRSDLSLLVEVNGRGPARTRRAEVDRVEQPRA